MKKFTLALVTGMVLFLIGCAPTNALRNVADMSSSMNRIGNNTGASNSSAYGGHAGDAHYIQDDDYFYSDREFESGWIRVELGKAIQAATPETKNEAKLMDVKDGKEIWTSHFWKTRVAEPADIKMGAVMIMFDYSQGDFYIKPENQERARTGNWFMAKITDTSNLYQNVVMVSGGYKVKTDNLRVIK